MTILRPAFAGRNAMADKKGKYKMEEGTIETRVREMENLLNKCQMETDAFTVALDRYANLQKEQRRLFCYYGSTEWYADREADEAGELPVGISRGVLTEDTVYDLIEKSRDTAIRMLELSTEILKNL